MTTSESAKAAKKAAAKKRTNNKKQSKVEQSKVDKEARKVAYIGRASRSYADNLMRRRCRERSFYVHKGVADTLKYLEHEILYNKVHPLAQRGKKSTTFNMLKYTMLMNGPPKPRDVKWTKELMKELILETQALLVDLEQEMNKP
jgi:hypothetical protein